MTFYLDPSLDKVHLALFYYNFKASNTYYSHVGLGVNAMHTLRVLRRKHVHVDAFGVKSVQELDDVLSKNSFTHAVIEAPWVPTDKLRELMFKYPDTHFVVRSHSQIGFLQVEAGAVKNIRDDLTLAETAPNLTVSANSRKLAKFFRTTYGNQCLYLPNLYDMERVHQKRDEYHGHRELRIGSFGATRLLKNHTSAAAAALTIARERNANLKFYMSTNREEHGQGILQTIRNMFKGLPWAEFVENPWQDWSEFRRTVHHMDLCMQVSFTETFNIVTADAAAEGVPSVVSHAIEWAPDAWKADVDTVEQIARVGSHLLSSHSGAEEGQRALKRFVTEGTDLWLQYLSSNPTDIFQDEP